MTTIAAQFLLARFQCLYDEREEKADLMIVSSDDQGRRGLFRFCPRFDVLFLFRSFV